MHSVERLSRLTVVRLIGVSQAVDNVGVPDGI